VRPNRSTPKVRLRGRRFFDHYSQATLFFHSQSAIEQEHIVKAFRFELGQGGNTTYQAARSRYAAKRRHCACSTGGGRTRARIGHTAREDARPHLQPVDRAPSLSLFHEAVESAASRKIAILAADGVAGLPNSKPCRRPSLRRAQWPGSLLHMADGCGPRTAKTVAWITPCRQYRPRCSTR
jgi:hypothetical protein